MDDIKISGHRLERYKSIGNLKNSEGVYVIIDHKGNQDKLIDVKESKNIKGSVFRHVKKSCWCEKRKGEISIAVIYAGKRKKIKKDLMKSLNKII